MKSSHSSLYENKKSFDRGKNGRNRSRAAAPYKEGPAEGALPEDPPLLWLSYLRTIRIFIFEQP
jgi:hypothetical protein